MKFKLILAIALIALAVSAQTNNPFVDASTLPTNFALVQPTQTGTALVADPVSGALQWQPVRAVVPAPDKVEAFFTSAQTMLNGALSLLLVLSTWWMNNRSKLAALVPTLIKSVESHGSPALKQEISRAAGAAGTEPALNKLVRELTPDQPAASAPPAPPAPSSKPEPTIVPEVKP